MALAGAAGTLMRFALSKQAAQMAGAGAFFPYGTYSANLLGSFLLGVVFIWGEGRTVLGVDLRLVVGTGMMGGFTTYSTFNLEALRLFSAGHGGRALLYMALTLLTCLAGGAAGIALGRMLR